MGRKIGRPSNKDRERLRLAERRSQVLQMTIAGKPMEAIASEFAVTRQTISNDLRKALETQERDTLSGAAELRQIQSSRLTQALDAIWLRIKEGNIEAIGMFIRLCEREAKLLGLDAPTRVDLRQRIEAIIAVKGWEPQKAVAEFEQVMREHSRG